MTGEHKHCEVCGRVIIAEDMGNGPVCDSCLMGTTAMRRFVKIARGHAVIDVSVHDLRALQAKLFDHKVRGLTNVDLNLVDACISQVINGARE